MNRSSLTPEQKAKYVAWIKDGTMTRHQVAERAGVDPATVGQWCKAAGLPALRKRYRTLDTAQFTPHN